MDRKARVGELRKILARYRGGRFEASGSGGANGMVFFIDGAGQQWFLGGFQPDRAAELTRALNVVLELLDASGDTRPASRPETIPIP
jgi:hypothetical protein